MLKNKKADTVQYVVIFLVLNLIFFASMFVFVARAGSGINFIEQKYAKQIALTIDGMRNNTEVEIYLYDLYEDASENKFHDTPVVVDTDSNLVTVRLIAGGGSSYPFYTNIETGGESLILENQVLTIKK